MRRVLPMVISFLFRIEQLKDDDPREDAPHFSKCLVVFATKVRRVFYHAPCANRAEWPSGKRTPL